MTSQCVILSLRSPELGQKHWHQLMQFEQLVVLVAVAFTVAFCHTYRADTKLASSRANLKPLQLEF